jgi:hypothetical protein
MRRTALRFTRFLLLNRPLARRRLRTFPDLNLRVVDVRQHLARGRALKKLVHHEEMAFSRSFCGGKLDHCSSSLGQARPQLELDDVRTSYIEPILIERAEFLQISRRAEQPTGALTVPPPMHSHVRRDLLHRGQLDHVHRRRLARRLA